MDLLTKRKEAHSLSGQAYGCRREGTVRESGTDMDALLYLKWVTLPKKLK